MEIGCGLHSKITAMEILSNISDEIKRKNVNQIFEVNDELSVLID